MGKLKVFGTMTIATKEQAKQIGLVGHHCQIRVTVAAPSRKAAAAAFGISAYEARKYMTETGNDIEVARALASPGTVFGASIYYDGSPVIEISQHTPATQP